jgi:hypothetical protein
MLRASLLAYMISGAFLPRAYFDFFYTLVATIIIMKVICERELIQLTHGTRAEAPALALAEATTS